MITTYRAVEVTSPGKLNLVTLPVLKPGPGKSRCASKVAESATVMLLRSSDLHYSPFDPFDDRMPNACSEHRWPAKRGTPKLSDFREDNFVKILAESVLRLQTRPGKTKG